MSIIRKFVIGVAPFVKMYRMRSVGGQVVDSVLALRMKALSEDFFEEVFIQTDNNGYKLTGRKNSNALAISNDGIAFTRDYYESGDSFDFAKVLEQFRVVWGAVNSVLLMNDVRRIGIVAEYMYSVPGKSPSVWMRNTITPLFESSQHAEKFHVRFEDRALAADGLAPDPKKADFTNTIYSIYDSQLDGDHPAPGYMYTSVDVQRYFAPVIGGKSVIDETLRLKKTFETASSQMDGRLKKLGAVDAKK